MRPMKTFGVEDPNGRTELDGCVGCQFFWFDPKELTRLGIELKDFKLGDPRVTTPARRGEPPTQSREGRPLAETLLELLLRFG